MNCHNFEKTNHYYLKVSYFYLIQTCGFDYFYFYNFIFSADDSMPVSTNGPTADGYIIMGSVLVVFFAGAVYLVSYSSYYYY